jgi:hypothetical protein
LKIVKEKITLDGGIVTLDDTLFINCKYTNCTLLYEGGECMWQDTTFANCKFVFSGAAAHVMRTLTPFGFAMQPSSAIVRPN